MELGFRELQERDNPKTTLDRVRDFYWKHEIDINGVLLFGFIGAIWMSGVLAAFMMLSGGF